MADGMALAASPTDVKTAKSRAKTKRRKVKVDF